MLPGAPEEWRGDVRWGIVASVASKVDLAGGGPWRTQRINLRGMSALALLAGAPPALWALVALTRDGAAKPVIETARDRIDGPVLWSVAEAEGVPGPGVAPMSPRGKPGREEIMLRLHAVYADPADHLRALDQEIARGVLLVKGTPPEGLAFRDTVVLDLTAPGGSLAVETEVVSILPGVGVAIAFPAARVPEVRALLDAPAERGAEVADEGFAAAPTPRGQGRHRGEDPARALRDARGSRGHPPRPEPDAARLRPQEPAQVTLDEVTAWAKNPQMSVDFLKQIGDRKDWLSRPAIAQALVRNPKTPADLALRALDHVGLGALRQMAKGAGAPPHVVQAARKKVIGK